MGSDGFEKVLIGTRGAREAFLDGGKGRAAKNSVRAAQNSLNASGAKLTRVCVPRTVNGTGQRLGLRRCHGGLLGPAVDEDDHQGPAQ